ncbi:MAG TPA: TonB family protein [Steroidobacteraceae bacterium]|nr:TonB family protein [Steroidobacteraceae bacterium]
MRARPAVPIRSSAWLRKAAALLLATAVHTLIVVVFVRGFALNGARVREAPLQVSIVPPAASAAFVPPLLRAPALPPTSIPVLIEPVAALPAPEAVVAPAPVLADSGHELPPQFVSAPLDTHQFYPETARISASQGQVLTLVCVYSTGEIASVELVHSSGHRELDAAGLALARQTRWKAAIAQGRPVARCSRLRIDFSVRRLTTE